MPDEIHYRLTRSWLPAIMPWPKTAKPFPGQVGFVIIPVAALLSTAPAINAILYGTAG